MNKWIAEFDLEDGDTMPEHLDLEYKGGRVDFHCRPLEQEPILDKVRAEIDKIYEREDNSVDCLSALDELKLFIDKYKVESEPQESEGKE